MWLSLAWSVIPKHSKAPFVKYIKQKESDGKYDFILKKIRKVLEASDNDWKYYEDTFIKAIEKDMVYWFTIFGIEKARWKEFHLNFDLMKGTPSVPKKRQSGLTAFIS
jgi:hypothetical protein